VARIILIQDDWHCELQQTEYTSFDDALEELRRRALILSTDPPNRAPCTGWRKCGRSYTLCEFEKTQTPPWKLWRYAKIVDVDPTGATWNPNYERDWAQERSAW
jgi:hypothetical protein